MNKIIICFFLFNFYNYEIIYSQNLGLILSPAFHDQSKIAVDIINDSCYIKLIIYDFKDTTRIKYYEENIVLKSKFDYLQNLLNSSQSFTNSDIGFDGILVKGTYIFNFNKTAIYFQSPEKRTENHKLLKNIIKFLINNLKNKSSRKYIKRLKLYL